MANLKNAIKAIRQTKKRTVHNLKYRGDLKTLIKNARRAIEGKEKKADELLQKAQVLVDKMTKKHILHKNAGARILSRLYALKKKITK